MIRRLRAEEGIMDLNLLYAGAGRLDREEHRKLIKALEQDIKGDAHHPQQSNLENVARKMASIGVKFEIANGATTT